MLIKINVLLVQNDKLFFKDYPSICLYKASFSLLVSMFALYLNCIFKCILSHCVEVMVIGSAVSALMNIAYFRSGPRPYFFLVHPCCTLKSEIIACTDFTLLCNMQLFEIRSVFNSRFRQFIQLLLSKYLFWFWYCEKVV